MSRAPAPPPATALVVGIGNEYRSDDGAGLLVARRVRAAGLGRVEVREEGGDVGDLLASWSRSDSVFLVDSVRSDSSPGTIYRFDARAAQLPSIFVPHVSSHSVGLAEAVELAQALDELPLRLIVYAIEGADFSSGTRLSAAVQAAIPAVAERLIGELGALVTSGERS